MKVSIVNANEVKQRFPLTAEFMYFTRSKAFLPQVALFYFPRIVFGEEKLTWLNKLMP